MLAYKRENFCALFDQVSDYVAVVDYKGIILEINSAFLTKLGYQNQELTGSHISNLFASLPEADIAFLPKLISEEKLKEFKLKLFSKTHCVTLLTVKATLLQFGNAPAICLICRETKIPTEKKEMIENTITYKELTENADEIFWIFHKNMVSYVSPSFEKVFGISAEKAYMSKCNIYRLIHPDDKRFVLKTFIKQRNNPDMRLLESFRIIRPDGEMRWIWIKDFYVKFEDEHNRYTKCGIAIDITKLKNDQERFINIEKQAHLERIKSEFFANICHELRTPINIITSTAQMLQKNLEQNGMNTTEKNRVNRYLRAINQNSFRLLRMMSNIIDITRIDAGLIEPVYTKCNIVSVIEDIALSVAPYTEKKGIKLIFDTEVEEKYICCDPCKIERILLNLISNALKHTDEGGNLWINIYDRGNRIAVSVKDNGSGIDDTIQDLIFEKFGQADKSLTRRAEGSGVGLYLAKALVEMQKGTISVNSNIGEGSEFIFELPVTAGEECYDLPNQSVEERKAHIQNINIEFSDIYM